MFVDQADLSTFVQSPEDIWVYGVSLTSFPCRKLDLYDDRWIDASKTFVAKPDQSTKWFDNLVKNQYRCPLSGVWQYLRHSSEQSTHFMTIQLFLLIYIIWESPIKSNLEELFFLYRVPFESEV